jgi:Ulp1 family protease
LNRERYPVVQLERLLAGQTQALLRKGVDFIAVTSPQQGNGYDCGMFTIAVARFIAQYYLTNRGKSSSSSLFGEAFQKALHSQVRIQMFCFY